MSSERHVDVYLAKQESLIVEFIRRLLQAETKVNLLETTHQILSKTVDDYKEQADVLDTALNSIKLITLERDELKTKVVSLEKLLNECINERSGFKTEVSELTTLKSNYATLKSNYDHVLNELNVLKESEVQIFKPKKKHLKKPTDQEQEWIDGE